MLPVGGIRLAACWARKNGPTILDLKGLVHRLLSTTLHRKIDEVGGGNDQVVVDAVDRREETVTIIGLRYVGRDQTEAVAGLGKLAAESSSRLRLRPDITTRAPSR